MTPQQAEEALKPPCPSESIETPAQSASEVIGPTLELLRRCDEYTLSPAFKSIIAKEITRLEAICKPS